MEDDRAQVDLGIAADIEESQLQQAQAFADETQPESEQAQNEGSTTAAKQPKKRFVGRRAAAEAAAAKDGTRIEGESGAIQGCFSSHFFGS